MPVEPLTDADLDRMLARGRRYKKARYVARAQMSIDRNPVKLEREEKNSGAVAMYAVAAGVGLLLLLLMTCPGGAV